MQQILQQDVKYVKGVGPVRADLLRKELGLTTLGDLLYYFPYRYDDRSEVQRICDLMEGMPAVQVKGRILEFFKEGAGHKQRLIATFTDGTGYCELVWFRGIKFAEKTYKIGHEYLVFGKPTFFKNRFNIGHPEMEDLTAAKEKAQQAGGQQGLQPQAPPLASAPLLAEGNGTLPDGRGTGAGLLPHYHTTDRMKNAGLNSRALAKIIGAAWDIVASKGGMDETLPAELIAQRHLIALTEAMRIIHQPRSAEELPAAQRRLKFEELFYLQLGILCYAKRQQLQIAGYRLPQVGELFHRFYKERIPFELTGAQKRVLREIQADMASGRQMNRLLQGDVGSGKTMVALMTCLLAIGNGFQTCLMAPTEILAEQHLATLREQLGDLPVRVELLTGIVKGARRREILEATARGEVDILVGTHALIEPSVQFLNLGLAVVDEQHRFGVKQRASLWEKNAQPPHILVMTATPIPRTLAMTVYGDLDVSVIDELPPGRKPVSTRHYYEDEQAQLHQGLLHELAAGRQVYVVYPLIEETAKMDLQSLQMGYAKMVEAFPQYKVGCVHGKMKSAIKDEEMLRFKRGETQILVSTTVIEVGVNVPNASVMVIEDAQRFGLSQLHQLRGRVGRGADQSYCLLITKRDMQDTTRRRMRIMVSSTDGFEIAEEDLKLRGPGDLEGTQQSGMPFDLKIANVVKDSRLMQEARLVAQEIVEADPQQQLPQNTLLWQRLRELRRERTDFSEIS